MSSRRLADGFNNQRERDMSAPGRPRPEPAVLRQARNRPQDGSTSGLSPKGEYWCAQHEACLMSGNQVLARAADAGPSFSPDPS